MTALRRRLVPYGLLLPGTVWLLLFFAVPMYFMGEMALRSGSLDTGGFTFSWEWANFDEALTGSEEQLLRSFVYAGLASLFALLIAYPLAYAIALRAGRWKLLLLFAVVAPFFTTYLIRTIAWKTILADASPAVDVLKFLQIVPEDGRVLATGGAVVAGLTYNFLPFMILPIYASLERMDVRLIESAKDLYASSTQAFLRVTLPISALLLGGTGQTMVGNVIQSLYLQQRDYPEAAALSFVMMLAILAVVLVYLRLAGTGAFMGDEEESR